MQITGVIPQLRTTDLAASHFHLYFETDDAAAVAYEDFYAGIRAGNQVFHLKLSDEKDPSIAFVDREEHFHLYFETDDAAAVVAGLKKNGVPLVKELHETPWETREFAVKDDQGHTLYFGERR